MATCAIRPWISSASRYHSRFPMTPLLPSSPLNQGPTGVVEKPRGSKPTSPSMDPSRVAGALANGSATEGTELAHASALGDGPTPWGLGAAAFFPLGPREKVMVGAWKALAEPTRRAATAENFMMSIS